MEQKIRQVIEQCAAKSHTGDASFGELVGELMQAGVEAYHADYRGHVTTYYLPSGKSHAVPLPALAIPPAFDAAALTAAIRGAQAGRVKYPEFLQLSIAAGCVGYKVWIAGRHVDYFGRQGEHHVEDFPASN